MSKSAIKCRTRSALTHTEAAITIALSPSVNAFDDARVARAIEATKRKKLIFAGISLEVCVAFPAITAVGKGLDAYVAVDASGTFSETKRQAPTHATGGRRATGETIRWRSTTERLPKAKAVLFPWKFDSEFYRIRSAISRIAAGIVSLLLRSASFSAAQDLWKATEEAAAKAGKTENFAEAEKLLTKNLSLRRLFKPKIHGVR